MTNLLIEEKLLTEKNRHFLKPDSGDHVFRFCTFQGLGDLEMQLGRASIGSCFLNSTFIDCDWYDPFFCDVLFFETKFERCTFKGGSFASSCFVACEFDDCRFERNALGSPCTFDGVRWFDCRRRGCPGLEEQF